MQAKMVKAISSNVLGRKQSLVVVMEVTCWMTTIQRKTMNHSRMMVALKTVKAMTMMMRKMKTWKLKMMMTRIWKT